MNEPDVSDLLTVAQAIEILDAAAAHPRVVERPLADAGECVLARDVLADRDYPPFDKSQMDGFAVRSADVTRIPCELSVVGEIAAGQQPTRRLGPRETMAIMTGAPLPGGADGVIPIEMTQSTGSTVSILQTTTPARFVARRGSDTAAGATVLRRGARLGPAQIAVAASVGAERVGVFAKPRAAVLATGDELIASGESPGAAQIRNSNSPMLVALLKRLHCDVTDLGIVRDRPQDVRAALSDAMRFDVLLVTGGMSMGAYDYVPAMLAELNVEVRITKLRIKPGKPFVFGVKRVAADRGWFVFGLPGNPVAAFVCTARLASRLLNRLGGADSEPRWSIGRLATPLSANGPREFYQPVVLNPDSTVDVLAWKGSADVFTLARATALLVRAENDPARPAGDLVRVLEV